MTGFYVAAGFTFQQILFVSADLQHAALLLSWLVYNQPCSALQHFCNLLTVAAGEARPPAVRTTAQPYIAGRLPFFVTAVRKSASEVPLRFIDVLRYTPDIVRSHPRTASLLSGNSVLLLSSNQAGRLRRGFIKTGRTPRRPRARRALGDAPRSACPAPRQQILRQLANLPRVSLNGIFRCPINSGERRGDTHAVTGCSVGFEIH